LQGSEFIPVLALIEQFRIGAMHQQPDPWLLEVIAGMIETNEKPAEVAVREAYEEAGLELTAVQLISHYLASPGITTEEVFIYFAETDLLNAGGVFGLDKENEDILVRIMSAEKAIGMLDTREVRNAISIIALHCIALHCIALHCSG
jgi:ADP-ribose pyrophosphatase